MTGARREGVLVPPGSREAVAAGCRCPVLDNAHGHGFPADNAEGVAFWISGDCPIHALPPTEKQQEEAGQLNALSDFTAEKNQCA